MQRKKGKHIAPTSGRVSQEYIDPHKTGKCDNAGKKKKKGVPTGNNKDGGGGGRRRWYRGTRLFRGKKKALSGNPVLRGERGGFLETVQKRTFRGACPKAPSWGKKETCSSERLVTASGVGITMGSPTSIKKAGGKASLEK